MTYDQAVALTRLVVRYLSLPAAPLLPPDEERLVLEIYDAIVDVTVPAVMKSDQAEGAPKRRD